MELLNVMLKRRSIRTYNDENISDKKLDKIIKAGLLAPSSRNRKPCIFKVVKNKEMLKKLSLSKNAGSKMLESCNCAIVVFADTEKADTWIEDSSIALTYMDLMAANENVASCWVQSHLRYTEDNTSSEEYVKELFSMDDKYRVVGILSLGITDNPLEAHTLEELEYNSVDYID